MKKKIILVGAYGCGNKGDDAILEGILQSLGDDYDFTVTTGKYGGIKEKFHVPVIQCRMNEGLTISVFGNLLLFFPKYLVRCLQSDCVLIGGGSLLHDITKYNLVFFSILQKIAGIFRKKVIYIGVGAGPINTGLGRWLCGHVIGKAEKIFVRDIPDYKLLDQFGLKNIELTADMAFMVETSNGTADSILQAHGLERKKYVAVTASEWFKSDNFWEKDKLDFTEQTIKLTELIRIIIRTTGMPVLFIPTVCHDYRLGIEIQKQISPEQFIVLSDLYDCSQMAALVAESKFLFGIRMHSLIFAIRAGTPFITSIYDRKVESLLKRCNMMKYAFDFEKILPEDMRAIIEDVIQNEKSISCNLREVGGELKSEALKAVLYMRKKAERKNA